MGNYNFRAAPPPNNSLVKIKHDKFSSDEHITDDIMRIGNPAKVLKTANIYQSRPNAPQITVSQVQFRDGKIEAYMTVNLCPINK
jgi:hypothetical protein